MLLAWSIVRLCECLVLFMSAIVPLPSGSHLFTFHIIKNNQDWGSRSKIREQAEII